MLGQNLIIRGLVGNRLVGGTWTVSGTWTIPAVTLGGTVTATLQNIEAAAVIESRIFRNHNTADPMYIDGVRVQATTGDAIIFRTNNSSDILTPRLTFTGGINTAVATWSTVTHTGLDITSGQTLKVAGTQVVAARVVDARCDDALNTGDATSDGVIDALRDAMISHGLIRAA